MDTLDALAKLWPIFAGIGALIFSTAAALVEARLRLYFTNRDLTLLQEEVRLFKEKHEDKLERSIREIAAEQKELRREMADKIDALKAQLVEVLGRKS